eukprot:6196724-Pleurochrysis_carterae.AAC.1
MAWAFSKRTPHKVKRQNEAHNVQSTAKTTGRQRPYSMPKRTTTRQLSACACSRGVEQTPYMQKCGLFCSSEA